MRLLSLSILLLTDLEDLRRCDERVARLDGFWRPVVGAIFMLG